MRILMTGASGFLGTHLATTLGAQGHEIVRLVRRPATGPDEASWRPSTGELDPAAVAGMDAVINLNGANIGDRRWTAGFKRELRTSRVDPTRTLAEVIAELPAADRPAVLLNASGISWYGDTGDTVVDEDAPAGEGFMADMCRVWEAATAPAENAGVRVVRLRTAPLLDRHGGLLRPQVLPFRAGIGGRFGAGRQWLAWITLADWLAATTLLLERTDIAGPVNLTSPGLVTNAEFTRAFARALHRPALLIVPGFALRLVIGDVAEEVLFSHRAVPAVLMRAGYQFQHPDLAAGLRYALADGAVPSAA